MAGVLTCVWFMCKWFSKLIIFKDIKGTVSSVKVAIGSLWHEMVKELVYTPVSHICGKQNFGRSINYYHRKVS